MRPELRQAFVLKLLVVAVVVFPLLHAVRLAAPADQAAQVRISTDYRANKAACAAMAAAARQLCYEQAVERKKVARSELEYGLGGTPPEVAPRSDDTRVKRAVVEKRGPAAAPFKAVAL